MHSSHLDRIRLRISIWIPKHYHQEPVLSRLTSDHHLTVNITEARLGVDSQGDGWFDLELRGTSPQIQEALAYLQIMNVKVWGKPNPDGDDPGG